jgi:hypothetical protein
MISTATCGTQCTFQRRLFVGISLLKEAFEGLEPDEGKLSRPVLRGLAPSNGGQLLGEKRHPV